MSFLQPWILLALPMIALPVIIHLIHQRRFQSVDWAAMRFLLAARSHSRGYSRLRQWLILLLRMLAVAAAILAISRPLSRGWLASVAGENAAAIVLLDRSPSMAQGLDEGGESKLARGRRQVAAALRTLGTTRVSLIDSVTYRPIDIGGPDALREIAEGDPADASADLPRMLQAACELLRADPAAGGSIWICSDQRADDWKPDDGAWRAIREALAAMPRTVRVNLLALCEPSADNVAVRVTRAAYEPRGTGWELLLDLSLKRESDRGPVRVPVGIDLGGARSTVEIELTGTEAILTRHAIPLDPATLPDSAGPGADPARGVGWGRVSIPADANPADNGAFFTFSRAPLRRTVVVAEDPAARRALELVAGIPPDRLLAASVDVVAPDAAAALSLDGAALLLWQAPLPEGGIAERIGQFVDRGGQVLFLPPAEPTAGAFSGIAWGTWQDHSPPLRPSAWRTDDGWLATMLDGGNLPVGEIEVRRHCGLSGEGTSLATLAGNRPLLLRAPRDAGGVAFLATTPTPRDSDLATSGVVLYAMVQRAIDAGLAAVSPARQVDAGTSPFGGVAAESAAVSATDDAAEGPWAGWRTVAGTPASSSETGSHAGVLASDGRFVAVNRPAREDAARILPDADVGALFEGLSLTRLGQRGGLGNLVEEVWRTFLVALLVALVAEGLLSLPSRPNVVAPPRGGST